MKIAILPSWFPEKKRPNSGIFIYHQAKDIADEIETDVITVKKGWPARSRIQDGNLSIFSYKYMGLPNNSMTRLNKWANKVEYIFRNQGDQQPYSFIHAHDHLAGYAAMKISSQFKLPYILTLHNTNFLTRSFSDWKKAYIKKVLTEAHTVIAVGKKLYNVILHEYPEANVIYIPNYIDTDRFTLPTEPKKGPFKFLTVTSLHRKKRIDFMIKSFAKMDKQVVAELHIIGEGRDKIKLQSLAKKLKISKKVVFHGSKSNMEIQSFYHSCHVYLSSSEVETFGVSIIEAMSCGMPVLTTVSGGPEYLVNAFSGIVSSDLKYAENLEKIYDDYPVYDAVEIRRFVLNNYSKKVILPQLLSLYREVTN